MLGLEGVGLLVRWRWTQLGQRASRARALQADRRAQCNVIGFGVSSVKRKSSAATSSELSWSARRSEERLVQHRVDSSRPSGARATLAQTVELIPVAPGAVHGFHSSLATRRLRPYEDF